MEGQELSYEDKFGREGLTFDDVLLVPAESSVLPNDVRTATRLTRTIALEIGAGRFDPRQAGRLQAGVEVSEFQPLAESAA